MSGFKSLEYVDGKLKLIDQTKLPLVEEYIITDDYERIAEAIEKLEVRGAPIIGLTAAYGLALSVKNLSQDFKSNFHTAYKRLASTRPTAVNLFWALNEIKIEFEKNINEKNISDILIQKANIIYLDDINKCEKIAENGQQIFKKKSRVLTHCNTGHLVTAGRGTAFGVIQKAFENDFVEFVYVDETRPLLQGSRLTAFELDKSEIPFSIITDSTAAFLMKQGKVDLVITGADRITANGDTANKIGTYNLAVNCKQHNIPFYIAAPTTTIDKNLEKGEEIIIEERNKSEINSIGGNKITKENYPVYSPAFDVTPNSFITAIITEKDFHLPPYNFSNV